MTYRAYAIRTGMVAAVAMAGVTAAPAFVGSTKPIPVSGCPTFGSFNDVDIVYLGQYGGTGGRLPYSLSGASHRTTMSKVVGNPRRKTFFVVSAYEPTVWDFSAIDPSMIAGIHGSGFYEQGVAGVSRRTPVTLRHTSANNGTDPTALNDGCLDIQYKFEPNSAREVADRIRSGLGSYPTYAILSYQSGVFDLGFDATVPSPDVLTKIPDPKDIRTENPIRTNGLMPGGDGLAQLVSQGKLIPLRPELISEWNARGLLVPEGRMAAQMPNGARSSVGSMSPYAIVKSIDRLPDGLFGGNLANFVLAPGVSAPTDMDTHSSFYRYKGPKLNWDSMRNPMPVSSGRGAESYGPDGTMIVRSSRSQAMTRVDWSPNGQPTFRVMPPQGADRDPYIQRMREQSGYRPSTAESKPDEGGVPLWPFAILATVGGIAILNRKRIDEVWGQHSDAATETVTPKPAPQEPPRPYPVAKQDPSETKPTSPTRKSQRSETSAAKVMNLTAEVVDLTDGDAAIAEVSRLRKDLSAAMGRAWDDDIAVELESLVRHCSSAAAEYVSVRRGADDEAARDMEASLLGAARDIRFKIDELVRLQGRRDAGIVATHEGFIRRRHGPNDLGIDA